MATKKPDIAVYAWILVYQDRAKNSNKFYHVFVAENGMYWIHWGRVGSVGQSSAGRMGTFDDARDIGLRQVFAKKSKGYVQSHDGVKFMAAQDILDQALAAQYGYTVYILFQEAMRSGQFTGARDAVLKHYAEFADQAQRLLAGASENDFAEVLEQYEELKKVWEDINDKHGEVSVAMSMVDQTLAMRLVGGTV